MQLHELGVTENILKSTGAREVGYIIIKQIKFHWLF